MFLKKESNSFSPVWAETELLTLTVNQSQSQSSMLRDIIADVIQSNNRTQCKHKRTQRKQQKTKKWRVELVVCLRVWTFRLRAQSLNTKDTSLTGFPPTNDQSGST